MTSILFELASIRYLVYEVFHIFSYIAIGMALDFLIQHIYPVIALQYRRFDSVFNSFNDHKIGDYD